MLIETTHLTRGQVAHVLGMSDGWVAQRMRQGDLPRPGRPVHEYVSAFLAYRTRGHG